VHPIDPPSAVACPLPLTPPPEPEESRSIQHQSGPYRSLTEGVDVNNAEEDNTAGGMSLAQEDSMYRQQLDATSQSDSEFSRTQIPKDAETEKSSVPHDYLILRNDVPLTPLKRISTPQPGDLEPDPMSLSPDSNADASVESCRSIHCQHQEHNTEQTDEARSEISTSTPTQLPRHAESPPSYPQGTQTTAESASLSHSASSTPPWDFSNVRLTPHYPSSLLRPGSHFAGTQQSDRQIYNVDVKILTLSVPQSTVTGYLRIQGLTDEHQILTTFFTGEIIGGPNQKYTFQTKHPSWGATDKTDLQHWARFPAWRPLAKDAKRDINFAYPTPGSGANSDGYTASGHGWWQRENIFMRWKEWFLVPDHRVTSIQGASFEGFYYICFNQVEKRISGIYFHARSER
jgi:glucose-induced degradation protein 4